VKKNPRGCWWWTWRPRCPGLDLYYTVDNTIPNQYYPKYNGPVTMPEGADTFRVISYRRASRWAG
jgi:hexosaminidase